MLFVIVDSKGSIELKEKLQERGLGVCLGIFLGMDRVIERSRESERENLSLNEFDYYYLFFFGMKVLLQ